MQSVATVVGNMRASRAYQQKTDAAFVPENLFGRYGGMRANEDHGGNMVSDLCLGGVNAIRLTSNSDMSWKWG